MDIRDILKSFDSLSEAKTTTDKGVTTHKGDYGREFDTDEEGNAVVKKVKSTEPKPKGRRPDPDRPKLGKDDPKNKKVGDLFGRTTGAVPKGKKGTAISGKSQSHPDNKKDDGTGDEEPTSKKSLKEYFDQLDQALNEEGYSTAPMPGAVAVKDASGKVVATAKNPAAAAAFEKGDITIGGDEQGMAEGSGDDFYAMALQKYPQLKRVDRETVINALNGAYEDYLMHYGYEGIGPEEESSMIDHAVKGLKQGMDEGVLDTVKSAVGLGKKPPATTAEKNAAFHAANKGQNMPSSGNTSVDYDRFTGRDKVTEKDVGKHNNANTGFDALVRKLTPKYGKEAATKIAGAQFQKQKMNEVEAPTIDNMTAMGANLGAGRNPNAFESKKKGVNPFAKKEETGKKKCPPMSHIKKMCQDGKSVAEICKMHPDCDQKELKQMVADCKKTLDKNKKTVKEARFKQEYRIFLESKGINVTNEMLEEGWKEKLAAAGTAAAIGATSLGMMGGLPGQNPADSSVMRPTGYSQQIQANAPLTAKADALAKINKQFANEYYTGVYKIDKQLSASPKLADQETAKFTQQLLAKYQANESKKPDANKNRIPDYAEDGKGPNDTKKKGAAPKKGVNPFAKKDEKKKVKEGMEHHLQAARLEGKSHALRKMPYNCSHDDMEEARCYHDGFKEGLDECYGQMPILGRTRVGEMGQGPEVDTMASYGADELGEMDKTSYMKQQAINTPGDTFKAFGQTMRDSNVLDEFAFEALDKQLNAILEGKEVSEGMTVSISKGQQGSPDSVSVSAQDAEADELLSVIKSAGLGLFGGDDSPGMSHAEPMTVDNGGEPAEIGAGGNAIEVVGDHDGMMNLMKKLSGIGGGEQSNDEHSHDEETCESCGGMMEAGHSCGEGQEMVDEVESVDQMTYQMAEDNPPDSGADNTNAEIADTTQANQAAAAYNPSQDIDEGGDGGEASDVGNVGVEAGDADEEMQASMNEVQKLIPDPKYAHESPPQESDPIPDDSDHDPIPDDQESEHAKKESMSESSFANLYRKIAMLSEESTSEKDDKAEKAAKKVAKDIEYDEDHKGKDDDKAEEAGKKVKKDIEYDDKKDKKEKKLDEWANDAGPGKSASDTAFETDMDFMMNVISGGLNKRKATGQTTIPVVASQLGRQMSRNTTSINESVDSSDAVTQWKKLAGLK